MPTRRRRRETTGVATYPGGVHDQQRHGDCGNGAEREIAVIGAASFIAAGAWNPINVIQAHSTGISLIVLLGPDASRGPVTLPHTEN